jgi:hypothetical protein
MVLRSVIFRTVYRILFGRNSEEYWIDGMSNTSGRDEKCVHNLPKNLKRCGLEMGYYYSSLDTTTSIVECFGLLST